MTSAYRKYIAFTIRTKFGHGPILLKIFRSHITPTMLNKNAKVVAQKLYVSFLFSTLTCESPLKIFEKLINDTWKIQEKIKLLNEFDVLRIKHKLSSVKYTDEEFEDEVKDVVNNKEDLEFLNEYLEEKPKKSKVTKKASSPKKTTKKASSPKKTTKKVSSPKKTTKKVSSSPKKTTKKVSSPKKTTKKASSPKKTTKKASPKKVATKKKTTTKEPSAHTLKLTKFMNKNKLSMLTRPDLIQMAKDNGIKGYSKLKKDELIDVLVTHIPK